MTTILEFLRSNIAADLSVALLHTLWQGVIVTSVLFLVLKSISGKRSQLRYRLSIFSLLVIVLCWLGTFSILQYEPAEVEGTEAAVAKVVPAVANPQAVNSQAADPAANCNAKTTVMVETVHRPSNNSTVNSSASSTT